MLLTKSFIMPNTNYITPEGYQNLQNKLYHLVNDERPKLIVTINWAAGNGDRSENADYIYGKRRLRELDKEIYQLNKTIENANIVDYTKQIQHDKIFFGATVTFMRKEQISTIKIVGCHEIDPQKNYISWISPLAKALLSKMLGDICTLKTMHDIDEIEIIAINY